jgi:hypothetical protein
MHTPMLKHMIPFLSVYNNVLVGQNSKLCVNKEKALYYILPIVLYECETWSLTLEEKLRLRVFGKMMLGRIFGPKWQER